MTLPLQLKHAALACLAAVLLPAVAADIPIYTLQGSGATSAYVGQTVTTTGVVTRRNNNGFFIQDLQGDGNPATSDGIFVFSTVYTPAVGSLVNVAGTLVEFNVGASTNTATAAAPLTEISTVTAVTVLGTGYSIAPVTVNLPLAAGDSLERFEGMLVRVVGPLTVQQNFFEARYGQLTLGAGGRHQQPTNVYRPGTPQALALADLQSRSRLLLDDGSSLQNVNPTPYFLGGGVPRAGDVIDEVTGVIDYGLATASNASFALYRIHPTAAPSVAIANPRANPPTVGGNLRVASMNVLNFFTTFTNGQTADGQTGQGCTLGSSTSAANCRGANSLAEFQRQRSKIVRALAAMSADAVGLMEIQNNGNTAAQNLVTALNAVVGDGTYAVVPLPAQGTGTDAIRVAMIYKPSRLSLSGASVSDPAAINNRPTFAQTFAAANGERFTVVVNHLKSKGSCPAAGDADAAGNTDAGDGQGCWNLQRKQQAQQLRTFVAQVQATAGSNDALLIGDFNAYGQEDPIFELTSNGYIDQAGRFDAAAYSYVFDGTSGRLDQAIGTATLSPKVNRVSHWHINADEQVSYDYNFEFKQPACATCAPDPYADDPYRSSDHDPVLVGLNIYRRVDGTVGRDTLQGSPGDDIITGGVGADTLSGNGGANIFVYTSVRDAGDTITDFVPGTDVIDVSALLASLGYAGNDPVRDGWLKFRALARNATSLDIDPDGPGPADARSLATLLGVSASNLVASRDLRTGIVRSKSERDGR